MTEAHLYDLIARYEELKHQLDALPVYTGYDEFNKTQNEGERRRIVDAMQRIEQEMRIVCHKEHPELVSPRIEILIANVKTHVEPPQPPMMSWEFNPGR
jgi:hypothetical protein